MHPDHFAGLILVHDHLRESLIDTAVALPCGGAEGDAVDEVVKDRPQDAIREVLVIFLNLPAREVKRHDAALAELTIQHDAMRH